MEIDPDFARNGLVYITYTEAAEQQPKDPRLGVYFRDVIQTPNGAVLLLSDGDDGELLRLTPTDQAPD